MPKKASLLNIALFFLCLSSTFTSLSLFARRDHSPRSSRSQGDQSKKQEENFLKNHKLSLGPLIDTTIGFDQLDSPVLNMEAEPAVIYDKAQKKVLASLIRLSASRDLFDDFATEIDFINFSILSFRKDYDSFFIRGNCELSLFGFDYNRANETPLNQTDKIHYSYTTNRLFNFDHCQLTFGLDSKKYIHFQLEINGEQIVFPQNTIHITSANLIHNNPKDNKLEGISPRAKVNIRYGDFILNLVAFMEQYDASQFTANDGTEVYDSLEKIVGEGALSWIIKEKENLYVALGPYIQAGNIKRTSRGSTREIYNKDIQQAYEFGLSLRFKLYPDSHYETK